MRLPVSLSLALSITACAEPDASDADGGSAAEVPGYGPDCASSLEVGAVCDGLLTVDWSSLSVGTAHAAVITLPAEDAAIAVCEDRLTQSQLRNYVEMGAGEAGTVDLSGLSGSTLTLWATDEAGTTLRYGYFEIAPGAACTVAMD